MTEKSALYAFVAGEVSRAFYGRNDLAKYPLGLALCENFLVDYKGGLLKRPGTKFIGMFPKQPHRLVRFRSTFDDYVLLIFMDQMLVLRAGGVVLDSPAIDIVIGFPGPGMINYPPGLSFTPGLSYYVEGDDFTGVVQCQAVGAYNALFLANGIPVPDGNYSATPLYSVPLTFSEAELTSLKFSQDLDSIVCTSPLLAPFKITYVADDDWQISAISNTLPPAPTGLTGTASASGGASTSYVVTAVVDGVESPASTPFNANNIVNFTATTGKVDLSWSAVAGASHYFVYRTFVFPSTATYPGGYTYGYLGQVTGTAFIDANVTADYTKAPLAPVDFFAGNNNPRVYTRFQQRGIYAGLVLDPLSVVGSISQHNDQFGTSFPAVATDSFKYTLDSDSLRPIKHMLPLRYGLMLFTDDLISQLRGSGDNRAVSAVSAFAETQGYTSVSDVPPVAINLDILYMTQLHTAMNAMLYTEYTNSFTTQDIMVLSSHLFGENNAALRMEWAAEPHKILHILRADGQRVTLTYERAQEVFGWARHRTKGNYLDAVVVREANYNLPYYTVERELNGTLVLCVEQEKPRVDDSYEKSWFVDCGLEHLPVYPTLGPLRLHSVASMDALPRWEATASDISWAEPGQRLYANGALFRVEAVGPTSITLVGLDTEFFTDRFNWENLWVAEGEWGYGTPVTEVSGLWHLEGQTVAVQADGDAWLDFTVTDGKVSFPNPALRVLVGLAYSAKAQVLPIQLRNYVVDGKPLAVRGVAFRQLRGRGLFVGPSFDKMEELPSNRFEPYESPLSRFSELSVTNLFGGMGWGLEAQFCIEQPYPLPIAVLGIVGNLDVGDD